jgi:hypothetical protein
MFLTPSLFCSCGQVVAWSTILLDLTMDQGSAFKPLTWLLAEGFTFLPSGPFHLTVHNLATGFQQYE